jgi:hypothetical protein
MATDRYGYLSNCVFIDEAAFYVNMKKIITWLTVDTCAEIVLLKFQAKSARNMYYYWYYYPENKIGSFGPE